VVKAFRVDRATSFAFARGLRGGRSEAVITVPRVSNRPAFEVVLTAGSYRTDCWALIGT
jgi:hypothetical protein